MKLAMEVQYENRVGQPRLSEIILPFRVRQVTATTFVNHLLVNEAFRRHGWRDPVCHGPICQKTEVLPRSTLVVRLLGRGECRMPPPRRKATRTVRQAQPP